MKYNYNHFSNTLNKKVIDTKNLIGVEKICSNLKMIELDLHALNYLICKDEKELKIRINYLFDNNPQCFRSIFILLAIRDKAGFINISNNILQMNNITSNPDYIYDLLVQSKLANLIFEGKIKNFIDYTYGVEVGMDTNARKNRNGRKIENYLYTKILEMFNDNQNIEIFKQQIIEINDSNKKFDIVIWNKINNKKILIESSYYNTTGSKINETNRSYLELSKEIKAYHDYLFIWLVDGQGLLSVKNQIKNNFNHGYIYNHSMFFESIKKLVS